MIISNVFAMVKADPDRAVRDLLVMLFTGYESYGLSGEKLKTKMQGYLWAVEGKPPAVVERVVKDYLSGSLERERGKRGKLPTSEEFGAQLRVRSSEIETYGQTIADTSMVQAPPFGPLWSVKRFKLLIEGPVNPMPKPTAFMAKLIDQGGESGERYRRDHQANNGYPVVNSMHRYAEDARGCSVESALLAHCGLMEPVPVDGEVFSAWKAEHERRGWPWLPSVGRMRVVYFPQGGPLALDAFESSIAS